LEVSGAVRLIYRSLGVKGLIFLFEGRTLDQDGHNRRTPLQSMTFVD